MLMTENESFVDAGLIVSIGVDGSDYKELKRSVGLRAFALINGVLLWVTKSGK